jgi:hypothetical protein
MRRWPRRTIPSSNRGTTFFPIVEALALARGSATRRARVEGSPTGTTAGFRVNEDRRTRRSGTMSASGVPTLGRPSARRRAISKHSMGVYDDPCTHLRRPRERHLINNLPLEAVPTVAASTPKPMRTWSRPAMLDGHVNNPCGVRPKDFTDIGIGGVFGDICFKGLWSVGPEREIGRANRVPQKEITHCSSRLRFTTPTCCRTG